MFNKLLAALSAMLLSVTTFADVSLSGSYEGTLDSHGEYTQDIETTLKGTAGNSTVTVVIDENLEIDDLYVETTLGAFIFKLGDYSGSDPDVTKLGVTTTIGDYTLGLNQESGGSTTIDVGGKFAGIDIDVTNITNDLRKTTATYTVAGLTLGVTHQKVSDVNQTQSDVSTVVSGATLAFDHNQNAARDAYEDGSFGGSVSTLLGTLGTVKVEGHKTSADVKTYSLAVTRGIWTAEWEKVDDTDGAFTLKAVLKF